MLALSACSGSQGPGAPTAAPSSVIALGVTAGSPEPLDPGTYTARSFSPAPTFALGEGWSAAVVDTRLVALTRAGSVETDCLCIIAPDGAYDPVTGERTALPADLTEWLAAHPALETSNPSSLQVGNRAALQIEVAVAASAPLRDAVLPLLTAGDHTFSIAPGEKGHVIVIEDPSGPLVVGVRSPEGAFADYFRAIEPAVGSLGFGG